MIEVGIFAVCVMTVVLLILVCMRMAFQGYVEYSRYRGEVRRLQTENDAWHWTIDGVKSALRHLKEESFVGGEARKWAVDVAKAMSDCARNWNIDFNLDVCNIYDDDD